MLIVAEADACRIVVLDFHVIFASTQLRDTIYYKIVGLFRYARPCSGHRRTILSVFDCFIGLALKKLNSMQLH